MTPYDPLIDIPHSTMFDLVQMPKYQRELYRSVVAIDGWTAIEFDAEYEESMRRAKLAGFGGNSLQMENKDGC